MSASNLCPQCGQWPQNCMCSQPAEGSSSFAAPLGLAERTSLSVIEHKLLTALNDESKVAILATKQNLEDILVALEGAVWNGREVQRRCKELADGMRQLLREAFPPNGAGQLQPPKNQKD